MKYKLWNNVTGWAAFLVSAVVFLMTIEPTASFWDCGEFIATAFKLEVGHPPGAPLFMIKEASNIVKSEGGITEMTVILHVRNRSNSKISGIEVSDYIPSLVGIGSDVPIGSLQPAKVLRHEKKGTTIVKWTLDALNVSEERVLSYRIKSKLPILGSFSLPAAKATFGQNNKTVTSTSNRLGVGGDNY